MATERACASSPSASARPTAAGPMAARPSAAAADEGGPLEEVEHAEPRGKPGAAPGGEDVVGSGDIVAQSLGDVPAEEDRAGVPHPAGQSVRLGNGQLQMLGRDAIDERRRRIEALDHDDAAVPLPARRRRLAPSQGRQMRLHRGADRVGEGGVVGDQDRLRRLVVLGLRQQVDRDPGGVGVCVGDDQHLRRPGDHVDPDLAEHLPLGRGDIGIAGADDLVDRGDALGAVGQGRHRLGAADAVDLVDAGEPGRGQDQRVEHPVRRGHGHDQAVDAGDAGRQRVHQHRRRVGGGAARHIEAGRVDRRPAIAEANAACVHLVVVGRPLPGVEPLDPLGGELEGGNRLGVAAGREPVDLVRRHPQRLRRKLQPVEPAAVVDQRRVAAGADVGDDRGHRFAHIGRVLALCRQHGRERGLEAGRGAVKPQRHRAPPASGRSSRRSRAGGSSRRCG